jgi:hypothetical protein
MDTGPEIYRKLRTLPKIPRAYIVMGRNESQHNCF